MKKLEMSNINKSFFGVQVLHNVNFSVTKGSIHALIGENGAGKSTLMNILGGVYTLDSGIIKIDDKEVSNLNVNKAMDLGIAFVHQEINLFNDLLVYENIFMNKEITKGGILNRKEMIRLTNNLFDNLGVDMKATDLVGNLSTSKKQLLEISKALFANADLLILDEPTTALNNEEIENFFRIIRNLKEQGKTFIFISHKMPEIFNLCDEYTVLRNGHLISSGLIKDTTPEIITSEIVGKSYSSKEQIYEERKVGNNVLEIKNLCGKGFRNINLDVKEGEIIGFTGLQGAGSSELMQALFGITKTTAGEVLVKGRKVTNKSTKKIMKSGVGMVPANRKENSVFESLSILDNFTVANFTITSTKKPFFSPKKEIKKFNLSKDDMLIKCNSHKQLLVSLSGGNQQKVIVGRWLNTNADILLLDNPTQGVDVGAKNEIYKLLIRLSKEGKTIIFNTLEIPEIQKCADKCCVFYHGEIEKILERNEINEENVMRYATHANKLREGA